MIAVVPLRPEDRPAWQELFRGYNEFYGRGLTDELADRAWSEFQADERMHALGARSEGRLAGIAHFLVHPSTTSADVCYLQDLFTASDLRGRGIGRALIRGVTEWASAHACSRVYWMTHETNATARRLYDRVAVHNGFLRYEIELAV
ncbi:MAG: GNAT family N-acetyltransferase [Solirubrobacteraceae bacterium]